MAATHRSSAFLRPEHLVPVRNLSLRAKLIVEGMIAGLHRSPYHGFSAEFREYRPYLPGESARAIDWRKYAKCDRTVVRLFDDETNLYAHLLVDKSASMGFASKGVVSKFEYARTLAASLCWILVRQRDAVGLCAFDQAASLYLPPRSTNTQLKLILSQLQRLGPGNQTRCGDAIHEVARTLGKRGMCIVISDFLDDAESVIRGLRHLRFKRQDVLAFMVLDPAEIAFRARGPVRMRDMESGRDVLIDGRTAAHFLSEGMAGHRRTIENACRELKIDLEVVSTDEPFARFLLRALEKRRRMY
jgi:uncharacterized protein (DUF58 family)